MKLKLRNLKQLFAIYFLVMLAFNLFYIAYPIYVVKTLNWSVSQTGIFFTVLSLLMVIVQGPVLSRLSKKYSETFLMTVGGMILVCAFLFFATVSTTVIYTAAAMMAVGNGLMWPSTMSALSKAGAKDIKGRRRDTLAAGERSPA